MIAAVAATVGRRRRPRLRRPDAAPTTTHVQPSRPRFEVHVSSNANGTQAAVASEAPRRARGIAHTTPMPADAATSDPGTERWLLEPRDDSEHRRDADDRCRRRAGGASAYRRDEHAQRAREQHADDNSRAELSASRAGRAEHSSGAPRVRTRERPEREARPRRRRPPHSTATAAAAGEVHDADADRDQDQLARRCTRA